MSLDRFGCFLHLVIVGHIGLQGEGTTSGRFDFPPGRLQPVAAAREKRHPGAASGKFAHSRAPDPADAPVMTTTSGRPRTFRIDMTGSLCRINSRNPALLFDSVPVHDIDPQEIPTATRRRRRTTATTSIARAMSES